MKVAKPNIIDRLVGAFFPRAGLKRLRDRTLLSNATGGYKGGKRGRRSTGNWIPGGGDANADTIPDLTDLRSRARDLRRNIPIATGAIATKVTNVVGEGLRLQPAIDRERLGLSREEAQAWNRFAQSEFELACKTSDFSCRQTFAEQQALIFGAVLDSGDVLVIRRYRKDAGDVYGAKLLIVEADRISNPNFGMDTDLMVAGVEHNQQGKVIAYHISDRHPGERFRKALNWRRVPARYKDGRPIVIHLYEMLRPDQARGIPYLSPVVEALKSLGDYTDAEVRAAVVSAMFTVFIKGAPGTETSPLPTEGEGSDGKDEIELGAGAVIDLAPDEDIATANPGRPNPQFDGFVQAFLRQIGVALELPFELLIKHFTASYSASRAALEMAWQTFRSDRNWLARRLCQPFYEMVLEEAIVSGRLIAPGFFDDPAIKAAWCRADWIGPVKMSLDPVKDANADKLDLENGTKTRRQITTERTGGDWLEKTEQLGNEAKARKEAGLTSAAAQPIAEPPVDPDDDPDKDDEDDEQ